MIQLGCKFEREGFRLKYMYIYSFIAERKSKETSGRTFPW